jgi:lipoprotein-releasing system ATP-binding protein
MSTPHATPLVEMRHVDKVFKREHGGELIVVQDVNFALHAGQVHAITGRSGSGKSTLMLLAAGYDRPSGGQVLWEGRDAHTLSQRETNDARQRLLGFVHQGHHLLPGMSALDNVALPLRISKVSKRHAYARAGELLERVGLGQRMNHHPGEMSGGERQRVGLARSLANRPRLLIADEPTGNLDHETGLELFCLLETLSKEEGQALLLVTHDQSLAARAEFQWHFQDRQLLRVNTTTPARTLTAVA